MHLIVNPAAAGGKLGRRWPRLAPRLRRAGLDVPMSFTAAPGHATTLARELLAAGEDTLVV
ncbi:MAG: diacylglycerol kinase family lipid kinase, partial [Acidobacteriota bacterium]